MGKNAPPKKDIDKKSFEACCKLQCTLQEISFFFGCSMETIETWVKKNYGAQFQEVYKQYVEEGLMSLRRAQFRVAVEKENPQMLIHLGKTRLKQVEKQIIEHKTTSTVSEEDAALIAEYIKRSQQE